MTSWMICMMMILNPQLLNDLHMKSYNFLIQNQFKNELSDVQTVAGR